MHGLEKTYGKRLQIELVNVRSPDSLPLQEQYGFSLAPELFLVDGAGVVRGYWDEVVSAEQLQQAIDQIMNVPQGAQNMPLGLAD